MEIEKLKNGGRCAARQVYGVIFSDGRELVI